MRPVRKTPREFWTGETKSWSYGGKRLHFSGQGERSRRAPDPGGCAGQGQRCPIGPAVVGNVLEEIKDLCADLSIEDSCRDRIQVYSTVGRPGTANCERGTGARPRALREATPSTKGLIQGSVVVLRNRDASILAEAGVVSSTKPFDLIQRLENRVRKSLRQPWVCNEGPCVYLAAFSKDIKSRYPGSDGTHKCSQWKETEHEWISNYDGQLQGYDPPPGGPAESRKRRCDLDYRADWDSSLIRTARSLGVQTPLQPYATTALVHPK